MHVPEAVAGQTVVRIEMQGPAKRLQGPAIAADARVTETAESVLEDAQARQHFHRVAEIHQHRQQKRHGSILHVFVGQNAEAEAEAGAHDADLDLGFFLVAGESQQIEERDAEENLHGEDGLIVEMVLLGEVAELAEPVEQPANQADGQRQNQADARQTMAHLPQRAEGKPGHGAAAERRQEQLIEPRLLAD